VKSLNEYLENKPLFYDEIDYDRFPKAFSAIKSHLKLPKIVHIVGTNGKGSTGRFLAQILVANDLKIGHYTSPHIFKFNERFWLNGDDVSDEVLNLAHEKLQRLLNDEFKETLSYFEYATLLACVLFEDCDIAIFEAGMGSQFDATAVLTREISLFTPISLDHTVMLGKTTEEIAKTKFYGMAQISLMNDTMDKTAARIGIALAKNEAKSLKFAKEILSEAEILEIKSCAKRLNLPKFQVSNLTLAVAGAKALGFSANLDALKALKIAGRMQKIASNLTVDVGHNFHAASAVKAEFKGKKVVLIYNAFADKDVLAVLRELRDVVKRVEIYEYESQDRALAKDKIVAACQNLGLEVGKFERLNDEEEYLVFGSFMLVEHFLRKEFANLYNNN